jgi:phage shock protein PspC (stress-responsive transcriptional regulator)
MPMICDDVIAAFSAAESMSEVQREHIRGCPRCRATLEAARQMLSELDAEPTRVPEGDVAAVENAVRREHVKSIVLKVALGLALVAVVVGFIATRFVVGISGGELALITAGVAIGLAPFAILYIVLRKIARRDGKTLYRRLHPARWWFGVCVGLAEATGIDRNLLRVAFVLLTFFHGIGLPLYLGLVLAMPVHPEDREYLWRFQAKRLLARFRSW